MADLPVVGCLQFTAILMSSVQLSSVAQSCLTLCDPMNRSTPGLPVHHQLPEFTQTHIHRVSDVIQLSHSLSSPSPPAHNPSQHKSLFQWVNSAWGGQSTGVSALASFLPKKAQGWISFKVDFNSEQLLIMTHMAVYTPARVHFPPLIQV